MAYRWSTGACKKLFGVSESTVDKILNGAFTSATTNWTANAGTTISSVAGGDSGNCLKIVNDGAAAGSCYQDITTKTGQLYRLKLKQKDGTAGGATYTGRVQIGSTADPDLTYDSGTITNAAWTAVVQMGLDGIYFIAPATTTRITLLNVGAGAGDNTTFDTVTCVSMSRSLQDIFKDCILEFRTGTQPTSANDAPTGTLLVTFYRDGVALGLNLGDAVSGGSNQGAIVSKSGSETWTGTAVANGTAGWWRLRTPGDGGGSSTSDERIDGSISTAGAELNMNDPVIVNGVLQAISQFQITLPGSA